MTHVPPDSSDDVPHLETALWSSGTLLSALETGLFTRLADSGPLDVAQLSTVLQLSESCTRPFVDALVTYGVLQRLADGRYANTEATGLYLDRTKPSYIGNLLEIMNATMGHSGAALVEPHTALPSRDVRVHGAYRYPAKRRSPAGRL